MSAIADMKMLARESNQTVDEVVEFIQVISDRMDEAVDRYLIQQGKEWDPIDTFAQWKDEVDLLKRYKLELVEINNGVSAPLVEGWL